MNATSIGTDPSSISRPRRPCRGRWLLLALSMLPWWAAAQDYPTKPVRIIVPFATGGVADASVRVVAERLGARLGQAFVVESKPGAQGNIGTEQVAKAAPDGYTLLLGADSTLVIRPHLFRNLPYDSLRDFTAITKLGDSTLVLVAHPSFPAASLPELIAYAKRNPGLNFGTGGLGGPAHLAGEFLARRAGIELKHIAYKGGGQSMTDVLGGHIPLVITAVATAQQYVKEGKLKAIGVLSAKRSPALPEVATFIEGGLEGFDVPTWYSLVAPARTPVAVVDKLYREIAAILAEPAVRERYASLGLDPVGNPPAQFAAQIRQEHARWGRIVEAAKIEVE